MLHENWISKADLDAHLASPHIDGFRLRARTAEHYALETNRLAGSVGVRGSCRLTPWFEEERRFEEERQVLAPADLRLLLSGSRSSLKCSDTALMPERNGVPLQNAASRPFAGSGEGRERAQISASRVGQGEAP